MLIAAAGNAVVAWSSPSRRTTVGTGTAAHECWQVLLSSSSWRRLVVLFLNFYYESRQPCIASPHDGAKHDLWHFDHVRKVVAVELGRLCLLRCARRPSRPLRCRSCLPFFITAVSRKDSNPFYFWLGYWEKQPRTPRFFGDLFRGPTQ